MKTLYIILLLSFASFSFSQYTYDPKGKPTKTAVKDTTSLGGNPSVDEDIIYDVKDVDIKPECAGGLDAFYKYIGKNFIPPDNEKAKGKSVISFVVEKDGSLNYFMIVKKLGYGIEEQTIKLIKFYGSWKPAIKNGKPVRVSYVFPVTIN